jgi:uncharacterized protein (DUF1800 family)
MRSAATRTVMMLRETSAIAANRFGLGARPKDAASIGDDPAGWLEAQLDAVSRKPTPLAEPPESAAALQRLGELRIARRLAKRAGAQRGSAPPDRAPPIDRGAVREYVEFVRDAYRRQVAARYARAIGTDAPFVERLVHFWANHFAVSVDKQPLAALAVPYENEAIRPHVTGNFYDLLLAVERHPAMILFLDNQASMGPNSMLARAARRRRGRDFGLNENLGREILELHTLGVDGGYEQADVTEFAKVLTGWSIGGAAGRLPGGEPGRFDFRAAMHEPGAKTVVGTRYAEGGVDEGERVLADLARHPATARHLATKLARHFVADAPPPKLVERLERAYLDSGGELLPVYRALLADDASWREPLAKYKTPQDLVISTYRALDHTPDDGRRVTPVMTQLGQRPLRPGSPAGWPDTAASWDSGDALLKRIEWAAAVGRAVGDRAEPVPLTDAVLGAVASRETRLAVSRAESASQALGLLFAAPEFQRR